MAYRFANEYQWYQPHQIAQTLYTNGWSREHLTYGVATVLAESRGNPQAEDGLGARGWFQFMPKTWEAPTPTKSYTTYGAITDPIAQSRAAWDYLGTRNYNYYPAWSTHAPTLTEQDNSVKKFMPDAVQGVNNFFNQQIVKYTNNGYASTAVHNGSVWNMVTANPNVPAWAQG